MCKIFTSKKINLDVFCSMMPRIWNQEQTIIVNVGFNMFLCKFKNARIKGFIMESVPWFYDRALLLFEEPTGDSCGEDKEFRYVSFWTHFHKLPYACFSRASVMEIGSLLGKVEKVDIDDDNEPTWGSLLRVKVQIDVHKTLKRGIFLKSRNKAEDKWIKVTYEKLPDFCYGYGHFGHTIKECEAENGMDEDDLPYGGWLREPTKLKLPNSEPMPNYLQGRDR